MLGCDKGGTMNETQARMFREGHNTYVNRLARMSKGALVIEWQDDMADRGMTTLFGGPRTKDELISELVEMRYPLAQVNEASHVVGHQGVVWPACKWCQANLTAAPFADGCPDCGTPDGRPCAGDCPRHNDTPGDAA
jgi:hypothetical protein